MPSLAHQVVKEFYENTKHRNAASAANVLGIPVAHQGKNQRTLIANKFWRNLTFKDGSILHEEYYCLAHGKHSRSRCSLLTIPKR